MNKHISIVTAWTAAALMTLATGPAFAKGPDKAGWRNNTQAAPLSGDVRQGLQWLAEHQLRDGSWGQGEESRHMGRGGAALVQKGNVGDTCFAGLAMLRSGSTPKQGPHAKAVVRAAGFVAKQVEDANDTDLWVTKQRGTRLQSKLGPYIDTFASVLFLTELKGEMPDAAANERIDKALHKVLSKVQRNQRDDGSWDSQGWAPALAQAVVTKGINKASRKGAAVKPKTLDRASGYARGQFDMAGRGFGGGGTAGVELYGAASALGSLGESVATDADNEPEVEERWRNATKPAEKAQAKRELDRIRDTRKEAAAAKDAVVARMEDPAFVSGFGSNGGEEFLSYMLIGEELAAEGGVRFAKWSKNMTANLVRIQNQDGSWTGHHCITGRTFCTAAALLVLTVDRAAKPLASKVRRT